MNIAIEIAKNSTANKKKVGCIIVKNLNIIAIGYNGTPSGFDNICEKNGKTKPEVLHAESNAIAKCAISQNSSVDSIMYCTYAPCMNCAKLIVQSKIKKIYFNEYYKDKAGLDLLAKAGILCELLK